MSFTKKQFIDKFMDRIYMNGNKEYGKCILTIYEAKKSASELYNLFSDSLLIKKQRIRPLDTRIELANLIKEKFKAIKFKEAPNGNMWEGEYLIGHALINICFKYRIGHKSVSAVELLLVNKDRTYNTISSNEINTLLSILKNDIENK